MLQIDIPPGDIQGAQPQDLVAIIEIGSTRYDILTFWQPEVWAIVLSFGIAAVLKLAVTVMVTGKVLKRAGLLAQKQGRSDDREANRAHVLKPAKAMLGHALNLVASTVALVLQLIAWRLFVLPSAPVRMADIRLLSVAMKTLLVGYAAETAPREERRRGGPLARALRKASPPEEETDEGSERVVSQLSRLARKLHSGAD
ncbi:hypothetical protein JCM9279_004633 [Rhodotorula babjevae]